ncbi:hypothetical protein HIM_11163 [Hirsutella minnesotensis 3608]|uniref:Monopolin complex subunit Csm1/Pcs1 C-terminal domain-containing protein n=1 Tax=Hirsutella minnesotensis 3608 TaxID=1043627 RepID=A0A0F8A1H9_9HYPO|nr:hypothetical protein HIM_11163 [Hirsutella minnesotensis 3608]
MPPRAKPAGNLSSRMMPDTEADLDDLDSLCAETKPVTTVKRARGRPPSIGSKVTKVAPAKPPRGTKRKAVAAPAPAGKRQAAPTAKNKTTAKSSVPEPEIMDSEAGSDDGEKEAKVAKPRGRPKTVGPRGRAKPIAQQSADPISETDRRSESIEIPETQGMAVLQRDEIDEGPVAVGELMASDNEVKSDIASPGQQDQSLLWKRLGDLAKKYENLEMRHRDLRNVGLKAAERNFDRIKKQAEENFSASNELITQLKADLAVQLSMTEQAEDLRHQLGQSEAERSRVESTVEEMKKALATARSEIAALTAKLSANRNAEANAMVPGSTRKAGTTKPGGAAYKTDMSEIVQVAQAKEDLYGDLTGLIVRGMRRADEEDVFDCIQTGRNGTLHFKLALEHSSPTDNYESVQLTYKPQLNADRDNDLMELLPDYLVEEITFPRSHASKFYSRVMKSLSERVD